MRENLEIHVGAEGVVWLTFNASDGKSATLNMEAIANAIHNSIAEAALRQWCIDRRTE